MKYLTLILLLSTTLSLFGVATFKDVISGLHSIVPVEREKFKPQLSYFNAQGVELKCRFVAEEPLNVAVFVKDKDGRYFQSHQTWSINGDNSWQTLQVQTDQLAKHWQAFSNQAKWHSLISSGIFEIGVSFWSNKQQNVICEIKDFKPYGERQDLELKVNSLQESYTGCVGEILPVKFQLSREYFNPFDPKEISVDCQWITPDRTVHEFPAFLSADYKLNYAVTTEDILAQGVPYWELRYLPRIAGKHKFRVVAKDARDIARSQWVEVNIAENDKFNGFVQVSKQNKGFFEFENGKLFFPVGLNIHTNIDYRAETRLGIYPLADCGLRDYEEYFKKCSAVGINCIEVWMASWTFALEWSSRRYDYYGVGRYNLANAYKLDKLFELAKKYGIYINLVWDNHGKFAPQTNQEWHENPFNKDSLYSESDGGFLTLEDNLFSNQKFDEYFNQRSRYIAARYGQNPNIFAQQIWSEVDLALNFRSKSFNDCSAEKWHKKVIKEYQKFTPYNHLITTHVCGDFANNLKFFTLWQIPEVTHLVGDSYRNIKVPMFDQMRKQNRMLVINKPRLITEFGGPSSGSRPGVLEADLHSGLWSAIFQKQAGCPFLWWHDFVILGGRLNHFKGLTKFIKDIDFRDENYSNIELNVAINPEERLRPDHAMLDSWEYNFESMALKKEDELIGWVFNIEEMIEWGNHKILWSNVEVKLPYNFVAGRYVVEFFSTLDGELINSYTAFIDNSITLPPFYSDIAFKIRRVK